MWKLLLGLSCAASLCVATSARAAFLIDIDTDGADDAVLTFNANFAFGGDTTSASQSAASTAVGMTGGDSIFGGNGVNFLDTYLYSYTPAVDGDNVNLAGQALNDDGDFGGALAAGATGLYNVYATWPISNNVSGGLTTFTLGDGVNTLFSVQINQNTVQGFVDPNNGQTFAGGEWIFLGTALLDANTAYTLTQEAGSNTFVSMRSAGVLFDAVPEPASLALLGLGGLAILGRKRA